MNAQRPILYAEDDDNGALPIERAFKEPRLRHPRLDHPGWQVHGSYIQVLVMAKAIKDYWVSLNLHASQEAGERTAPQSEV